MRYAENDEDHIAIHQFLCIVAQPALHCEIDAHKSMAEVVRVANDDVALMAEKNGHLVGTLGLIRPVWWYGLSHFLTDRWFFVIPTMTNQGIGAALLAEAAAIGFQSNLMLIINGKMHHRAKTLGNGVWFTQPLVIAPGQQIDFDKAERDVLR